MWNGTPCPYHQGWYPVSEHNQWMVHCGYLFYCSFNFILLWFDVVSNQFLIFSSSIFPLFWFSSFLVRAVTLSFHSYYLICAFEMLFKILKDSKRKFTVVIFQSSKCHWVNLTHIFDFLDVNCVKQLELYFANPYLNSKQKRNHIN